MKRALNILAKLLFGIIALLLFLFFTFYLLSIGNYEVSKTVAQDSTIPHIELNNAIFHCETFGDENNPVTIVLHGGPGNDYRYLLDLKVLSDSFYMVFYDQRGTGLSPRVPSNELTLENSVADLNAFVDHFGKGGKVNIIGHSWGGMLAAAYLGKYPDKINKVVLAEPGPLTSERNKVFMERTGGFHLDLNFKTIIGIGKIIFRGLHVDGPDSQAGADYIFSSFVTMDMENHPMAGYYCDRKMENAAFSEWRIGASSGPAIQASGIDKDGNYKVELIEGVEQFKDTVLILAGECNVIIGEDFQDVQKEYFHAAKLIVIKNAGHTMFGEQPKESIGVVREYLMQ